MWGARAWRRPPTRRQSWPRHECRGGRQKLRYPGCGRPEWGGSPELRRTSTSGLRRFRKLDGGGSGDPLQDWSPAPQQMRLTYGDAGRAWRCPARTRERRWSGHRVPPDRIKRDRRRAGGEGRLLGLGFVRGRKFGERHLALATVAAALALAADVVRAGVLRAPDADLGRGIAADAARERTRFAQWGSSWRVLVLAAGFAPWESADRQRWAS